jgi:hypothetical protein
MTDQDKTGLPVATELIGGCVDPHRCDKPTIGAVDRRLNDDLIVCGRR